VSRCCHHILCTFCEALLPLLIHACDFLSAHGSTEPVARCRLELEQEWEQLQLWQQQQQSKLRAKEDALTARLKLQQREVERVAFEHRQTLLQEQARLLSWQAECQQAYQQQKVTPPRVYLMRCYQPLSRVRCDTLRRMACCACALMGPGRRQVPGLCTTHTVQQPHMGPCCWPPK
jgi:hypothetical protein